MPFLNVHIGLTPTKQISWVWTIYEKSWWVVILPILTHLGTLACTIHIIWELSQLKPGQTIFQSAVAAAAPSMFALPFATNMMITALVVARIKWAKDIIGPLLGSGVGVQTTDAIYNGVVCGVIESCVIYPVFLLLAIVLYALKTNALALVTGPIAQGTSLSKTLYGYRTTNQHPFVVVSIVPTLLWLQIKLGRSQCETAFQARLSATTTTSAVSSGDIEFQVRHQDGSGDAMSGITMAERGGGIVSLSALPEMHMSLPVGLN